MSISTTEEIWKILRNGRIRSLLKLNLAFQQMNPILMQQSWQEPAHNQFLITIDE